jgi:fluoride ion exporter CrcB/FEX
MLRDIRVRGAITSGVRFWIGGAVEQRCDRFPVGPQMVNFTDLFIMGLFEFLVRYFNAVRGAFLGTTDRVRRLQAQWWNIRVDFGLPKRIALRIATGFVRYAGIRIHERRKQVECD